MYRVIYLIVQILKWKTFSKNKKIKQLVNSILNFILENFYFCSKNIVTKFVSSF
ncbi:hypothetical protein KL86DYS1_11363 [uncultured Dysgonomonas sp.]|uniref:Uncharacterized protein n=1 Tax=uncultured Dysgonomonas sp. TaxID=206096 RepID=A0A212J7B2_9BACT|nr:hypothetical protein KL86DYS1_11363 [uncultured Dysgonomonas sp.]